MNGEKYMDITPLEEQEMDDIVQTLADTTASVAQGSTATTATTLLEPRMWLKQIVDAGRKRFHYAQFSKQVDVQKGFKNAIVPIRQRFLSGASWGANVTPGTAVNFTALTNYDGVEVNPAWKNSGVAISYDVIQQNVLDYVGAAREELTYKAGDEVDIHVADVVSGAAQSDASTPGAQFIYGGDATQASELADGDVITTDAVAEGIRKLETTTARYWTGGSGESIGSGDKNPWTNEGDFVLFLAPEQQEAFRTDSQFVNASEYGGDRVVHTGEIGEYLGVKIVSSNNTIRVPSGGTAHDATKTTTDITQCVMLKGGKSTALAFQRRPKLHVVDFPRELEIDLILEQSYGASVLHADSNVFIDVTQK